MGGVQQGVGGAGRPVGAVQQGVEGAGRPVGGVGRIAVLRAGHVGDLVQALPAIEALRTAYPGTTVTLLGTAAHADLLDAAPGTVDGVVALPPTWDVDGPDEELVGRFDLVVQLHGGGRTSNPFVSAMRPSLSVGARATDAPPLDRTIRYDARQHEVLRCLEVVALAGAAPTSLVPRMRVPTADAVTARERLALPDGPVVAVHPGATDPRRRWPADRFLDVAQRAVVAGAAVVIVGGPEDVAAAEAVASQLPSQRVVVVAGRTSLADTARLLAACDVLLANDSGPRHVAEAVQTSTVSVYWVGNVVAASPLLRDRHRVHVSWRPDCPVCGTECLSGRTPRCLHDVSFVTDVDVDPVAADVLDLLADGSGGRECV